MKICFASCIFVLNINNKSRYIASVVSLFLLPKIIAGLSNILESLSENFTNGLYTLLYKLSADNWLMNKSIEPCSLWIFNVLSL